MRFQLLLSDVSSATEQLQLSNFQLLPLVVSSVTLIPEPELLHVTLLIQSPSGWALVLTSGAIQLSYLITCSSPSQ